MAKTLKDIIRSQITQYGPMDIGQFMALCLGHPEHGYYMKQDPFGSVGDFTTAPEVSQMFGEMIGAWVCDLWIQMGQPEKLTLLECGPGRGTLMSDLMRVTARAPHFKDACAVHLLEISPFLKTKQAELLAAYNPAWHEGLDSVPTDAPVIVIGNEFLDALPFRQLMKIDEQWVERVVGVEVDQFVFGLKKTALRPDSSIRAHDGDMFEIAPARLSFVEGVSDLIKTAGGAALFLDYGHIKSGTGDTFQAVHKHEYVSPLENVGNADLTSHVDFEALGAVDAQVFGPVEQGAFLKKLGIETRAASLTKKADDKQAKHIQSGLHRLTHSDEMGTLFKVIGFTHDDRLQLSGFS